MAATLFIASPATVNAQSTTTDTLLNVSYDATREFYQSYDTLFARYWKKTTGHDIVVHQSHAGSGAQARAVIEGLDADVVTLGVQSDIDAIAEKSGLLPENWQTRLPNDSTPYTSTVVFLVRAGNPKHIHDWNDLLTPQLNVVTPNPKTSAGARWNFLAAYAYALHHNRNDDVAARAFVKRLYQNVSVLDSGSRGSITTFTQRGIGDVLITWENEALALVRSPRGHDYQLVVPSVSIRTQPPVAWVDANLAKHHTQDLAQNYLKYLYSEPAQRLACSFGYRSVRPNISCAVHFPTLSLVNINRFGGWKAAQTRFFSEGGVFDQISQP